MKWVAYFIIMSCSLFALVYFIKGQFIAIDSDREKNSLFFFLLRHIHTRKTFRAIVILLLAIFIMFGAVFGISHIPKPVQQELKGIEFVLKGESEIQKTQEVNISIDGRLHNGIFSDPFFEGFVEIDVYPHTFGAKIGMALSVHYWESTKFIGGAIGYYFYDPDILDIIFSFHASDLRLSSFVIKIRSVGKFAPQVDTHIIVAPAVDFDSAQSVIQKVGATWIDGRKFIQY